MDGAQCPQGRWVGGWQRAVPVPAAPWDVRPLAGMIAARFSWAFGAWSSALAACVNAGLNPAQRCGSHLKVSPGVWQNLPSMGWLFSHGDSTKVKGATCPSISHYLLVINRP